MSDPSSNVAKQADPAIRVGTPSVDSAVRMLLDKLPVCAYQCDPTGLITYYNDAAVRLWGRAPRLNDPEDRFCGSFKLYSPEGAPISHSECWMALTVRTQREYNGQQIVVERPGGDRVTCLAHANPIRDAAGQLKGALNVLVDISDQKRAEQALAAADHAKSEFLATVSHEIRTPLNAILGYLALLEMETAGPLTVGQRAHVERIQSSSEHLLSLIDELLDLSRLEAGEMEALRIPHRADAAIEAALADTRSRAEARGIEITHGPGGAGLEYLGDADRVRQLLGNLISNAIKFSDMGRPIEITCAAAERPDIGLSPETSGDRSICIHVRDSGIGIAPEQLERIFQPFVQVEATTTRTRGGSGLGLAISRRLARLMGGDLTVESTLGVGSVFTLWLPAAAAFGRGREGDPAARTSTRDLRRRAFSAAAQALLSDLNGVLDSYVERLWAERFRSHPAAGFAASLNKVTAPLLADLAVGLSRGAAAAGAVAAIASGSEVQRVCATEHAQHRRSLGWTSAELSYEYDAMRVELAGRIVEMELGAAAAPVLAAVTGALDQAMAHGLAAISSG